MGQVQELLEAVADASATDAMAALGAFLPKVRPLQRIHGRTDNGRTDGWMDG